MIEDSLLTFPCDLPVKVLGRTATEFRNVAGEIVRTHYVDLEQECVAEQISKNGTFLSITFPVRAQKRHQVDALYRDLTASDDILMVL